MSRSHAHRKLRAACNIIRLGSALQFGAPVAYDDYQLRDDTKVVLRIVQRIAAWETRSNTTAAELFAKLDRDGSGSVDVAEVQSGLSRIGVCLDGDQVNLLMQHMDSSRDGTLDIAEFTLWMAALVEAGSTTPESILSAFCNHLHNTKQTAAELFKALDADGSGRLDAAEFSRALRKIGLSVGELAARVAMDALDLAGDGWLHVDETVAQLEVFQRRRRVFASAVLGNVCDYLKKTRASLVKIFCRVDSDFSGLLDVLELQEALRKMGQDLSELEARELMQELHIDGGGTELSSAQFMDRLKQFKSERELDTEKCAQLFAAFDEDGSGQLDREEVRKLAEQMGLGEQLADESSSLTLDQLIADIETSRPKPDADADVDDSGQNNGLVTFEELLPWFMNVGRSYLPPRQYTAVTELQEFSESHLRELFGSMDVTVEDVAGERVLTEEEVRAGVMKLYPFIDVDLIGIAFEAADMDGSGRLSFDEFDELVRCLHFLNRRRHTIEEIMLQFEPGGVGDDEFYIGATSLGVVIADSQASRCFEQECSRLSTKRLTAREFLLWVCRHECKEVNDEEQAQAALAVATEQLEHRMGDYGDIYFEDLATVMFTSLHSSKAAVAVTARGKGKLALAARHGLEEAIGRVETLRQGIHNAIEMRDSFPVLPDEIVRKLVTACQPTLYFGGQNLITEGMFEDSFFVMRRGRADVLEGENKVRTVSVGDPLGELALVYNARRTATVRAVGPCEAFVLDRAAYDTAIASLPPEERLSPLLKMMHKFWVLCTGPDGSNRPEVDYAVYLKYHLRVSKTLTSQADIEDFDAEEERCVRLTLMRTSELS